MDEVLHIKAAQAPASHKAEHAGYAYVKHELVSKGTARHCAASLYEVPPGKAAYPYHYHTVNEESFYILSGAGEVRTPSGTRRAGAGDFLFFPAGEAGAHKLTNTSETEPLVYLDFDATAGVDVAFYPDSGKIGVFGKEISQLYKLADQVDYYEGE